MSSQYRLVLLCAAFLGYGLGNAAAAGCEKSFTVGGVPMISELIYKASDEFPGVKPDAALKRLSQAVAAEGFSGIKVNKSLGSIDAYQETSGSGRSQTLRVVARKKGNATRVDIIFNLQVGQVADKKIVRQSLCGIVQAAAG